MKGDFSRWTFDRTKHYSRVLSMQGRVFLDADFNEGLELQLQRLRMLTAHLLGPHAGPGTGFEVAPPSPAGKDFVIDAGVYYVNGVLCENDSNVNYSAQPNLPKPPALETGSFVVYLDVWERFLTYIEDEDPNEIQQTIREVALGGPDTAGRSKVVWQVKLAPFSPGGTNTAPDFKQNYAAFLQMLTQQGVIRPTPGKLAVRARKPKADDLPCATNPESRYRGPENQLYRVEIHDAGALPQAARGPKATYKWSRENGSVVFPIRTLDNTMVTVETLGRDERLGLKPGDLVEVVDDDYVLQNRAEPLLAVKSVDPETFLVELSQAPASTVGTDPAKHPILRRWEGAGDVGRNPDPNSDGYLALEDGVEVRFTDGQYRTGDYWMAPARTATGDVEWPGASTSPEDALPHGIQHAYAPLAIINVPAAGGLPAPTSLRRVINQLWS
jgi:uncharacterized protein DUF6519